MVNDSVNAAYLAFELYLLFICVWGVPLRKTSLALSILDENKR